MNKNIILETAVRDGKLMQGFESEPLSIVGAHSLTVKGPPIGRGSGSKDCVNLPSQTAVSRIMIRYFICIFVLALTLYSYVDQQNALTKLRLSIPVLAKQVRDLREENTRLEYEIDLFESPQHLMTLANRSEFSHLKHPMAKEVIVMNQGLAVQEPQEPDHVVSSVKPKLTLAIGAKQ